ncbi:hypothetical protein NP493_50g01032 [Ridgeia piscesae]|uniref:Uncharacterized protein n=1 Tax=Ridgeia piscesae TaxID=27915 RepID=A0AAD9PBP3_RIDPI|nr:hypothetical protein NP493_50g01032 [Ridgeia piscesae]
MNSQVYKVGCTHIVYKQFSVHVIMKRTHMGYSTVVLLMFFKMLAGNVVVDTNPQGALTSRAVHACVGSVQICTLVNMHTLIHLYMTISSLSIILYRKEIHVYI